jgi:riboflavin biosynthesis pyrimidine reductase
MSERPRYERLQPAGEPTTADDALAAADLTALAHADRPYLYANFVSTVDGRATLAGNSRGLGGDGDLAMLLALRDAADAVLVGPGTIRVEGYGRLVGRSERRAARVARGLAADPPLVLISRRFELPWPAAVFSAAEQPVIVFTERQDARVIDDVAAPVELIVQDCAPAAVLRTLRERGVRALLCEGGPGLIGGLLEAGVVDELFLTLAPLLTGDASQPSIVRGPPLADPARLELRWLLRQDQELYLRYRIRQGDPKT